MWYIVVICILLVALIIYIGDRENKISKDFEKEYTHLTKVLVDIRYCRKTKENRDKYMSILSEKRADKKMEDKKYNDLVNKIGELYDIRLAMVSD